MSESEYEQPENVEPIVPRPVPAASAPCPRRRSVFWPMMLIGLGALLLLSNLGIFPATGWAVLWQFWPVALIALGIDVIIGRRSVGGAIASGILILLLLGVAIGVAFFAEQLPFLIELVEPAALNFETVSHPLSDLESAHVSIDWTSAPGYLEALEDSPNLIEAEVAYRGELVFNVEEQGTHAEVQLDSYLQGVSYGSFSFDDGDVQWDVGLSPQLALDLWLDMGSGNCSFDLSGLNVTGLDLDGGSGDLRLLLPEMGNFEGEIDGGSGGMSITVPEGVGLRVDLTDGSGNFFYDERLQLVYGDADDDGVWETEDFDAADYKVILEIDQGSGDIRIR